MSACTCAPCGREFTSLTAFDKHQSADYRCRPAVLCADPATVGLVRQASGRWGLPRTAYSRARSSVWRAAKARAHTRSTPRPLEPQ